MSGRWQGSTRKTRLPSDWQSRRKRVRMRAHGRCEGPIGDDGARVHDAPRCMRQGTDCDHIAPGDDHDLSNLQWLCAPCHARKTQAEARSAGIERQRLRKRPSEVHPGAIIPR